MAVSASIASTSSFSLTTAQSSAELVEQIRKGLPAEAFDRLKNALELTVPELAHIVHIPKRTVTRRRQKGRLQTDESERVLRVWRLYERAAAVLEGADEARAWLKESNYALGEQTPLQYADTEPGARVVEQLLGQIEHDISV